MVKAESHQTRGVQFSLGQRNRHRQGAGHPAIATGVGNPGGPAGRAEGEVLDRGDIVDKGATAPIDRGGMSGPHHDELPLNLEVVTFPRSA
jgi:hypothetical protein